ncbi:MAG: hypothetical protein K1X82_05710 [Bacteroidia bacterium]|nr:hypothetical protein [Bacteroidia bacterium]
MVKKILLLILGITHILPGLAQERYKDFSTTIYEKIKASEVEKTWDNFHLNGKIKSVIEWDTNGDTSFLNFNKWGKLEMDSFRSSTNTSYLVRYEFNTKGDLRKITEQPSLQAKVLNERTFQNGWMDHFMNTNNLNPENNFNYSVSYENDRKKIRFHYTFPNRDKSYVYLETEEYTVTLGNYGRVLNQQVIYKTNEGSSGSNMSFAYDSLGRKTQYSLMDFCAGSNSCLIINGSFSYDKWGNIIRHSQQDNTIRNSTWSYSFSNHYLYDANACLLGKLEHNLSNTFRYERNAIQTEVSVQYSYEFDRKGNWIIRYQTNGKEKKVVAKRKILYYE